MGVPFQYVRLNLRETDQLGCFLPGFGTCDSKVEQALDDRFPNPKPGIERAVWILKNDLYSASIRPQFTPRQAGNIVPTEIDLPCRRLNQSRDASGQR